MEITIMVGPSGSGKSTEVEGMLREFNSDEVFRFAKNEQAKGVHPKAAVLSVDDITYDEDGFHPERLSEAHAKCVRTFLLTLQRKNGLLNIRRLIVDNTNVTAVELSPYIAIAAALDAPVNIVICQTTWQECMEKSTHGVPWHAIRRQCKQLERLLDEWPPFWPQPEFVERW
jgi:predicted kinase